MSSIVNVATHLAEMSAREPHRLAVAFPQSRDRQGRVAYSHLTFRQLHRESDCLAHGLESVGIRRGARAVLMVPPSLDFFTLTFALFKVGAVPVLIDPGMGVRHLGRCLGEAEPEAFIGVPKAHVARKILRWGAATIRITVTTGKRLGGIPLANLRSVGASRGDYDQAATTAEETAAVLFTSGSTGVAKGVVYTHGIFANQIELLRRTYGIKPGEVDLSTFPLFALFAPALGMTAIIPEMDPTRPARVDPTRIIEAVEQFGVTNLFGSPALINRVGRFGAEHKVGLPTLRRVISAGAPVGAKVIDRFVQMLAKGVQVHTPYGATESLPVASVGSDVLLQETRRATDNGCGVCVGRPIEPVRVRIIPIDDGPFPHFDESLCLGAGAIGEIAVSGPVVSVAYFNRPEATRLAKMVDPRDGAVWHRMGDVGYLDPSGRLWFCGRKTHRVVTSRGTLFTIPCEAVFNAHPDVFRSALVGVRVGDEIHPAMCIEKEASRPNRSWADLERELREIGARHPHTAAISAFLAHPAFPVDIRHNAKIFREKLAVWAARRLKRHRWPSSSATIHLPPSWDQWLASAEGVKQ